MDAQLSWTLWNYDPQYIILTLQLKPLFKNRESSGKKHDF